MTKKIIIFISLLILVLGLVFLYFFYVNKKTIPPTTGEQNIKSTQENKEVNINTQDTVKSEEITIPLKIKSNLDSWRENQNMTLLKEALLLTLKNNSNESFFEPWGDFIKNNSSNFIRTINQDTDEKLLLSTSYIYDWFINLSGEYEKMNTEEKQKISRDFLQIQFYINNK